MVKALFRLLHTLVVQKAHVLWTTRINTVKRPAQDLDISEYFLAYHRGRVCTLLLLPYSSDKVLLPIAASEGQLRAFLATAKVPFDDIQQASDPGRYFTSLAPGVQVICDPYFTDNGALHFRFLHLLLLDPIETSPSR